MLIIPKNMNLIVFVGFTKTPKYTASKLMKIADIAAKINDVTISTSYERKYAISKAPIIIDIVIPEKL